MIIFILSEYLKHEASFLQSVSSDSIMRSSEYNPLLDHPRRFLSSESCRRHGSLKKLTSLHFSSSLSTCLAILILSQSLSSSSSSSSSSFVSSHPEQNGLNRDSSPVSIDANYHHELIGFFAGKGLTQIIWDDVIQSDNLNAKYGVSHECSDSLVRVKDHLLKQGSTWAYNRKLTA